MESPIHKYVRYRTQTCHNTPTPHNKRTCVLYHLSTIRIPAPQRATIMLLRSNSTLTTERERRPRAQGPTTRPAYGVPIGGQSPSREQAATRPLLSSK